MDVVDNPQELLSLAATTLLLLLTNNEVIQVPVEDAQEDEEFSMNSSAWELVSTSNVDVHSVSRAALYHVRLWNNFAFLEEDLGYWVKPRSTAWFSRFLLSEYDDSRWLRMFRLNKAAVLSLSELVKPSIMKKNTRYRSAIPVLIQLAIALFKLTQGASLLICSEMFAVRRSTVSLVLREVIPTLNVLLRSEIQWPTGEDLRSMCSGFQRLCGLPGVVGAIDGTHFEISKPKFAPGDYYYFKSGGYNMTCQAVVDSKKRFLDVYVGMPGSVNDSRMLRRSSPYDRAVHNCLWDEGAEFGGFSPYLLGDAGYPLLPWLMVPHKREHNLPLCHQLFNKRLSRGRCIVENAFALLKQTFKELADKSELEVTFLPDVIVCCCLLHNFLLSRSPDQMELFREVLATEASGDMLAEHGSTHSDVRDDGEDENDEPSATDKRGRLGEYLTTHRALPM